MTVHEAVERERSRAIRLTVITGAGVAVATTLVLLAAGAALLGSSRWLLLPRELPLLLWLVIGASNAGIAWHFWHRTRATTPARVAGSIEREQSLREGTVRGALEIGATGALGRRAAASVAETLGARGTVLAPTLRRSNRRRAGGALAAAVAATAAALAVAPVFGDGLLAVLNPASAYDGSLVPALAFRGLPSDLLRGEPLRITISAPGRSRVRISFRPAGAGWQSKDVPVRDGVALLDAGEMRSTMHVVATDGRTATDTAAVTLAERPFVGATTMHAVYPAYLGRPAETLPGSGRVEVPRGTSLSFTGRSSVSLESIGLVSGPARIQLRPQGHTFAGRHVVTATATWSWEASSGRADVDVPEPLHLDVTPDSAPVADLLLPMADTAIGPGGRIGLRVGAGDDYGLADVMVEVIVERGGVRSAPARRVLASRPGTSWDGTAELDATAAGGRDGDVLHVRALATDASPWAQLGASRTVRVRVRTSEERREHARTLGDSAAAAADAIARAQRELERRTEAASRARDRSPAAASTSQQGAQASTPPQATMTQEASERARTIAQEQRQLTERVDALRDAAAELEKGLREAGALDSSLARQLQEAQDLMRQAMSPELMARMQQLEQAAQSLDGAKAREAMRDLAEMQRQLREQLEQSAEIIKRAAHEGAMQTLSDEARELASRQRALGDSARGRPDAAREAERLADRSERYAEDVQDLRQRLAADRAQAAAEGTSEARDAARQAEERLRSAVSEETQRQGARQPQSGQQQAGQQGAPPQAGRRQSGQQQSGRESSTPSQQQQVAQGAREAASQMDRAADAMQQARDAQVKEWKQELTAELDRAVQETLQMAREEQSLAQQARSGAASAQDMRSRQGAVEQGVDRTGQRLGEAGRRSALMSGGAQRAMAEAREKVQAATRELSQGAQSTSGRPTPGQADALEEAAESLNRAAASLARDRERANSASSASGFAEMMQQLQEMAQRQGSINGQAQSLMQMPGGQQSPQGTQMARALARQQRQVAQQLDDISAEAGGGRTGELAREARQLAEALEAGRLDARTAERQEQLFKRLLDAGRALEKEEREDTDRREARAAREGEVHAPAGAQPRGREARQFREPTWGELRGLTAEERRAILEYFRRINAEGRP